MSEGSNSVLLPASKVDFFALGEESKSVFDALTDDWRFARAILRSELGDIDLATSQYAEYASPDLVIIETDDISQAFIDKLEGLASNCVEGTEAVIIGPQNDVELYRKLVGMGVSDYLVQPVTTDQLVNVISQTLINKIGVSDSRLIAVTGGKGGVGATTIAQLLALNVSEELKQKAVLLDAAAGWSTIGISFGIEPTTTYSEGLNTAAHGTDEDLARMLHDVNGHLALVTLGGDSVLEGGYSTDDYEHMLDRLMITYPVVIVDLSACSNRVRHRVMSRAQEIVIVTTPQLSALRGVKSLVGELSALRPDEDIVSIVSNMKGQSPATEVPVKDIEDAMGHKVAASVPYEPKIFTEAETSGKPVTQNKAAADILKTMMPLANKAADIEMDASGKKKGKEGSFLGKIMGSLKNKE